MTCSKCSYKAEDGKQLFEHLFGEHLKDMSLFCSHCDFQGTTPSAVLLHLTENHGYDKEMCPQCGKVVRNLPQHKIIHNPQLYRQHKCDECGKGFVSNVDLRRHEMIHSGLKPHACTGERETDYQEEIPLINFYLQFAANVSLWGAI